MAKIGIPRNNAERRRRRHVRVRNHLAGTGERPRLVVYRSLKHIAAQIVDDDKRHTLMAMSDQGIEGTKTQRATEVGKRIAARAKESGVSKIVFDRAGYRYHGRVKALADGAREGGLEF
ncbi:MAG TPA: 50S ribosomal protein L18 [Gemmatimonadaceae bacterium]